MKRIFQIALGLTIACIVFLAFLGSQTTPLAEGVTRLGSISLLCTFGFGLALMVQMIRKDRKLRGKPSTF
jgi:hypothetical protein